MYSADHRGDPEYQRQVEWFGERLRFARQQAGVSQRQLGYMAAVSQSTISRAERGLMPRMRLELVASLLWCLRDRWPWTER